MTTRIFFLTVFVLLIYGCTSKEHLVFNNIPIDGPLDKFADELKKSGYLITDSTKKGEISLKGEFLNKDCTIDVVGTSTGNVAYKVIVRFPEVVPDSLQPGFGKIQNQLTFLYGPGTSQYQKYKKRERLLYNVPGLALEIKPGDFTRYTTDAGEILLEVGKGFLSITYLDKQNHVIWKTENGKGN